MKDKSFAILQRVGRSFMLPIAILPVAGLFLGVGGSFTNATMISAYNLESILGEGTMLRALLLVMSNCGDIIFANLPIIFAMGVAMGMATNEKAVAALAAAISFFVMHTAINTMGTITGGFASLPPGSVTSTVGIETLQMGVFGGIIVGLGVAFLHNKYYKIQLPQVLSFFGGTRFVPIVSAGAYVVVGIGMYFLWPFIQAGIYSLGDLVRGTGYLGTVIYGIIERALIPFGLHHVFYLPFWQTGVGGTLMVDNQLIEGAQNIFFAQLASPNTTLFSVEATRFMAGKFPFMIFGLPGASLAMYHCAKSDKRKVVGGLLLSAALTSMLTGITEPLEFTFLFVAPVLYGIHCVLAGVSFMLMHLLKVGVGMTFSGGFIDLGLFGILQGNAKTNWIWVVIVGLVYFVVYYLLFRVIITRLNLKTPGREEDTEDTKLYTRSDFDKKTGINTSVGSSSSAAVKNEVASDDISKLIEQGLGGRDNINDIDCCATRLRITVLDETLVDEVILKKSGAAGVMKKGKGIQVIYGPQVTVIKANFEEYLGK
jgi:PTS system D-glucosamine-specific IIC component